VTSFDQTIIMTLITLHYITLHYTLTMCILSHQSEQLHTVTHIQTSQILVGDISKPNKHATGTLSLLL